MSVLLALTGQVMVWGWVVTVGWLLLGLWDRADDEPSGLSGPRLAYACATGLVAGYLLLLGMQAVGVGWNRSSLFAVGLVTLGLCRLAYDRFSGGTPSSSGGTQAPDADRAIDPLVGTGSLGRWGWGDLIAGVAVLGYAAAAWWMRSPYPDFVYHWGLKAKRTLLAGSVDYPFLALDSNDYLHPDYPNLFSSLYALPALLTGAFDERSILLSSTVFLLLLGLVVRSVLRRAWPGIAGELAYGGMVLGLTGFLVGYLMIGSPDLPMALAVLLGALTLSSGAAGAGSSPPSARAGFAAAFAAASKIEGVALGGLLIVLFVLRHRRALRSRPQDLLPLLVPPILVMAPWLLAAWRWELFQEANAGALDVARLPAVLAATLEVVALPVWRGLPLVLVALPALLVPRASRWLALLCLGQLAFYAYVYLGTSLEPRFLILASLPRLFLHLLPTAVIALCLALAGSGGSGQSLASSK